MTVEEMDNMFDVLYNNITSNLAPGLNAYEKSVFLTKAQDEIIKNYFNAKSKGNNTQDGFDSSQKRQIDFSMLTTVKKITTSSTATFDTHSNSKGVELPTDVMMSINETVKVIRNSKDVYLQVVPIKFDEYSRLMSKPYKRPLKNLAWRLMNVSSTKKNTADIIIGPSDTFSEYIIRYIKRPTPIIISDLDGLTIDGYAGADSKGNASATFSKALECVLDPILHQEIVQRAVELAKVAWTSTGNDNIQAVLQAGQRSE